MYLQLSPYNSIFFTTIVVGLRLKPSLTSLRLNRSARWISSQFESRRLNVLCLFATPNSSTYFRLARFPSLYFDFMYRSAIVVSLRLKLSLTLLWLNRFAKWLKCYLIRLGSELYFATQFFTFCLVSLPFGLNLSILTPFRSFPNVSTQSFTLHD